MSAKSSRANNYLEVQYLLLMEMVSNLLSKLKPKGTVEAVKFENFKCLRHGLAECSTLPPALFYCVAQKCAHAVGPDRDKSDSNGGMQCRSTQKLHSHVM